MIEGQAITRTFAARRGMLGRGGVRALRGVDFTIPDRGAVSFIGESGCGKTTLGRILCGLESFDGGDLIIGDRAMAGLKPRQRAPYHRRIQMIHQDPYSALNPTRTIGQILAAPLALRAKQVGADPGWLVGDPPVGARPPGPGRHHRGDRAGTQTTGLNNPRRVRVVQGNRYGC